MDEERPPGPKRSVRRSISWLLLSNVVAAACQSCLLVGIARIGTESDVGLFVFALSVWAPGIMLANLGLRGVQSSDARDEYQFSEYAGLRIIALSIAAAGIAGLGFSLGWTGTTVATIGAVGLAKLVESVGELAFGLFQKHERMGRIAISQALKSVIGVTAVALALLLTGRIVLACVALGIVNLSVVCFYDVPAAARTLLLDGRASTWRAVVPTFHLARIAPLFLSALPMGMTAMLISLSVNVPRYYVKAYAGEDALGIFGAMTYTIIALTLVMSATCNAVVPRLAKLYALHEREAFLRLFVRFVGLGVAVGVGCVLCTAAFGSLLLGLVFGPRYGQCPTEFTLLSVGAALVFVSYTLQYSLTAMRSYAVQVPVVLIDVIVITATCAVAVPAYGLLGACLATVAAGAARLLAFSLALALKLRRPVATAYEGQ